MASALINPSSFPGTLSSLIIPAGTTITAQTHPFAAHVWGNTNLVTSCGSVVPINLPGLQAGAQELVGEWANIKGPGKFEGNFFRPPFLDNLSRRTNTHFDKVQCYWAITSLMIYLSGLGFDMTKVMGKLKPIIANVNTVADINAWFNPTVGDLTFGEALRSLFGRWALASDNDIVRHEMGHAILFCINAALTEWYAGDGGAIHEGFGDAVAALFTNDPEVSEDFPANTGREYGTKMGLRTVANDLKIGDVDREVHDLGQVYGGFWWGVRTALQPILGGYGRTAADIVMAFAVEHGIHYATNRPGPKDFIDAVIVGAKTYLEGTGKYQGDLEKMKTIITQEGAKRGMLADDIPQKGNRREISNDLLKLLLSSEPFTFPLIPALSAKGTFSGRDFHQQYLVLDLPGGREFVRMLGSGIIVFTDANGEQRSYSDSDVRHDVKVDTEIRVRRETAQIIAIRKALSELKKATRTIEELDRKTVSSEEEEQAKAKELDRATIDKKIAELTYEEAKAAKDAGVQSELVLLPNNTALSEPLYHRVQFGPSKFYVNAKTGHVEVRRMPMW